MKNLYVRMAKCMWSLGGSVSNMERFICSILDKTGCERCPVYAQCTRCKAGKKWPVYECGGNVRRFVHALDGEPRDGAMSGMLAGVSKDELLDLVSPTCDGLNLCDVRCSECPAYYACRESGECDSSCGEVFVSYMLGEI